MEGGFNVLFRFVEVELLWSNPNKTQSHPFEYSFVFLYSNTNNTMHNITIRKAHPNDLEKLLEFEQGIIIAERPFDATLKEGKIHYYDIEKMISAVDVKLLVAEIDSQLIGSGYARIETAKPYLNHETYAYLGFMYTDENHRGKGVNSIIIEALKGWCRSKDISELRLDVYNDNNPAIKAYKKVGFKKHLINMRMGL
ncbi:GNAT family N-acetyltransferase [Flavobacterium sp. LB1P62]|uniref:GNAT family N-acetyltransferase n=1 Tax=unclassified Flavobacterium TaxID=196869 RepID=UPI003AAD5555